MQCVGYTVSQNFIAQENENDCPGLKLCAHKRFCKPYQSLNNILTSQRSWYQALSNMFLSDMVTLKCASIFDDLHSPHSASPGPEDQNDIEITFFLSGLTWFEIVCWHMI